MVKLLLGFYPAQGGTVHLGEMDLKQLNLDLWHEHCGVVMQDGVIFSESIARNIAVDDGPIDMVRLHEAARLVCIDDFIGSLPLGYETKIGFDGMGISQGQKQRILIARAIYKDPEFIFLDEATNSLDTTNERQIVDNLDAFCKGKTVIVVAHRLSTVKNANKIIVLNHGHITESGTHSQLAALRGDYYNLVKNQLELGA